MTAQFGRAEFNELTLTLSSSKELGVLDNDYIEDYYGTNGQISLYHYDTKQRYYVMMNEVFTETPEIPHDVFRGFLPMSFLPDGVYRIEGRVRSNSGFYTILSEVANPFGNERIIPLDFNIYSGVIVTTETSVLFDIELGLLKISGSSDVSLQLGTSDKEKSVEMLLSGETILSFNFNEVSISASLKDKSNLADLILNKPFEE